ncbi:MAG: hypothetical protein LIO92_08625 [Clostridiales bacterium]|nr:hypothetical protein [Clostridiales bacterium]
MTTYSASGSKSLDGDTLFTIGSRSADDETVTATLSTGSGTTHYTLTIGGDAVAMPYPNNNSSGRIYVSLAKDADGNEVLTVRLVGTYFAIPESGKAEITYSSVSPGGSTPYSTYVNNVTFDPDSPFDSKGEGILETDESEAYDAVSAVASVTVAGAYATSSYKSVVELESIETEGGGTSTLVETDNSAVSTSSDNSIVLSGVDSMFRYTLSVDNLTDYAMTKLILFDNLPQVGDTYSVGDTARNSEFTVNLADAPNFAVYVTTKGKDEDGNETEITEELGSSYYEIQYSTSGEFETDDYEGGNSDKWYTWGSSVNAADVRAIRVIITDESATQIPAGATVSVTFDAVAYSEEGSTIEAGAIAWNNFGYHYALDGVTTELTAMPLVVGVQVPSAPSLTKELVDVNGDDYHAAEDMSFTFVVYEGSELTDIDTDTGEIVAYNTEEALVKALNGLRSDNSRAYRIVTLTVKEGESSATLKLTGTNGLDKDSSGFWWTWSQGDTYTITEFLSDGYSLKSWSETEGTSTDEENGNSFTFTYDREKALQMTCVNTCEIWDLNLTKVDADSYDEESGTYTTVLNGAMFALYSRTNSNINDVNAADTIEVDDETWYLYRVQTTGDDGEDGKLSFSGLTEESYYLVEVKAPDGYNLDASRYKVTRSGSVAEPEKSSGNFYSVEWDSNTGSITVTNEAGSELPETGGPGTLPFRVAGLLLMSVSAYLIYDTLKRRRSYVS